MSAVARLRVVHAVLVACALLGAASVGLALYTVAPRSVAGLAAALVAFAAMLVWLRGVFSRRRVVLWIEERVPSLRYALAALIDTPDTRVRTILEARVRRSRIAPSVALAALKLAAIPIAILLGAHFFVAPLLARTAPDFMRRGATRDTPASGTDSGHLRYRAIVIPPAYARQPERTLDAPLSIAALVASSIRVSGAFTAQATMPAEATVLRLESPAGTRLVALEPRPDSAPHVVLETPARDTVLRAPTGALRLDAQLRDDIGLNAAWFEIIVSSGSGELFEFRTAVLGRASLENRRDGRISVALPLDSLQLKPGDVVHLRAVARDNNPRGEPGASETRTLRVRRPGENDSLAVEAMPPPEVNQSELSQRMLIILTERLVDRMRGISTTTLGTESSKLAREQARLRKRVGEIIFTRLTGGSAEHVDDDATTAMDDTLSPGEALLKAASDATNLAEGHEHEEGGGGPVVGVNRNLLEAFNAMWAAERRLGVSEPRQALPHMRAALDAIQRARAAERVYLRGRAPRIVLDIAKIRLTGKAEGIDAGPRSPRAGALNARLERRARFGRAVELLASPDGAAAAIDSLMLVRVDALGDAPALAAAIGSAIDDLRAGRDATESLLAAHRALTGAPITAPQTRWSGSW